ncbi:hypothetical protein J2S11_002489 [Bacillus horti]|uniref:YtzI protein n=1 Tax=Caldalkalibacillus horti TaxID=77523 RepID=A0ABT9W005_9BACI|nr:hypothetical protein [Bacillus horti]
MGTIVICLIGIAFLAVIFTAGYDEKTKTDQV